MIPDIASFETARLRAERISDAHFAALCSLWQDERVMRLLGGVFTEEKCAARMQSMHEHWEKYGFGRWAWYEKESGNFAALAGFRCFDLDGWPEVTLGYLLKPEFWGMGYATELATHLAALAFERLGTESLVAVALPQNAASRRVMEKIGMKYNRDGIYENLPHVLYEIAHAEWRKANPTE